MRVLGSGARLEPFGDPISELPLLGQAFARLREAEVLASRIAPERLTFSEQAIATAPILADFAEGAPGGRPVVLAIPETSPLAALVPVSSVRRKNGRLFYDVFLDAPEQASLEELRASAEPVVVELSSRTYRRELPRIGPPPHFLDLPEDGRIAAHLDHWVHALWLAPLLVPAVLARTPGTRRRNGTRSWIAKDAKVHPTAFVERSIIGPDAVIGAHCSIRHSYVGAGARLADFTKVTRSVLGDGVHTLADATFSHVVSLGRGTLTNLLLRDVLIGRNVFLTTGVTFWADTLGETIKVEHHGAQHDTERRVLGGCVGHGSVLGARAIIAPGKALPNRTMIVMRREEGVLKIEPVPAGTPVCWDDAALVPYQRLRPGVVPDELGDLRAAAGPAREAG